MVKLMSGSKLVLTGGGAVAVLLLAGTGYALADTGTQANKAEAPYAQVAVRSDANGTIVKQEGVVSVTKVATGQYCVKAIATVDVPSTIPFAVTYGRNYIAAYTAGGTSACGGDTQSYRVYTYDSNGAYADRAFSLLVP